MAAAKSHTDVIDALLKGGADCNVQTEVIPFITIFNRVILLLNKLFVCEWVHFCDDSNGVTDTYMNI